MQAQDRVARFCDEHDLEGDPEYRILDLAAEVGEVAGDAAKSSGYGADPDGLAVSEGELGDALFSLLAVAESLDIDAEAALETSLAKYERRLDATGDAGSETSDAGSQAGESPENGPGGTDGSVTD
jgi:NTP pyrophosphatase (non-canonical NTP hydrolase)